MSGAAVSGAPRSGSLRCDLLIVGTGPAGAALAAVAAEMGLEVLAVEAGEHPRPKACAEYASPRIAEELERLGVDEAEWRTAARPLSGMDVIAGSTRLPVRYADRRGPRPAWGLDRRAFDALLARRAVASGARLLERTRLVELAIQPAGPRRRVTGGTLLGPGGRIEVRADRVVGADGARSVVARLLGVTRPVRFPRRLGLMAHVDRRGTGLDDHGEMHVGDDWYVGLAPIPGERLNVAMALPLAASGSAATRFERAIAALPGARERVGSANRLTPIRGVAPVGHRVSEVAGPGWLLVGDAAGFVDPFTGEGIYRALRSARAAASALRSPDHLVADAYRAERRTAFTGKDLLTWAVQGMLAAPPLLRYAVRRLERRPAALATFGGAIGDCLPASRALSPRFLAEVLRP